MVAKRGELLREPRTLRPLALTSGGHVMRLVNHNHIPMGRLKRTLELVVLLERINRDNGLVVVVEGIVIGWNLAANALEPRRF